MSSAPAPGEDAHRFLEGFEATFLLPSFLPFPSFQPAGGNLWAHSSQNFWMLITLPLPSSRTELRPFFYFCPALHICCPPPRAQGCLGPALPKCWLNERTRPILNEHRVGWAPAVRVHGEGGLLCSRRVYTQLERQATGTTQRETQEQPREPRPGCRSRLHSPSSPPG